jgi:hypothetical protein
LLTFVAVATSASWVATSTAAQLAGSLAKQMEVAEAAMGDAAYPSQCGGLTLQNALRPCTAGTAPGNRILVIGDSHAELFYAHFKDHAAGHRFTFLTYGGCPPLTGVNKAMPGFRCPEFIHQALLAARSGDYSAVVIAAFWPIYLKPYDASGRNDHLLCFDVGNSCEIERDPARYRLGIDAAFERLAEQIREIRGQGIDVTLLLPMPASDLAPPAEAIKAMFRAGSAERLPSIDRAVVEAEAIDARHRLTTLALATGAQLVDPMPAMCGPTDCPVVDDNGNPLYRDSNHLTGSAVRNGRLDFIDRAMRD